MPCALAQRRPPRRAMPRSARHSLDGEGPSRRLLAAQPRLHHLPCTAFTPPASRHRRRPPSRACAEPEKVRERYGKRINGTSLLLARRLVEAGVPFVTVFWKEDRSSRRCARAAAGGTRTAATSPACEALLPEFDRRVLGPAGDLHDRGLLGETLVLVTSEMGRQPRIGDPRPAAARGGARDHWTRCMSVLLAGGGVRGGQALRQLSDGAGLPGRQAGRAGGRRPHGVPRDGHRRPAIDRDGRPFQLMEKARRLLYPNCSDGRCFASSAARTCDRATAASCSAILPARWHC